MIRQLERVRDRTSGGSGKVYEIDRKISEYNRQIHLFTAHRARDLMDDSAFIAQSGAINIKIGTLRAERQKLLAEDESAGVIDALHDLYELLTDTEPPVHLDERLFRRIVTHISVNPLWELVFRVTGGLELTETISQ